MSEEIFGPLFPVITLERIKDSIDFLRAKSKPLALYAFTENENLQKIFASETSSDVILHYVVDSLPFGGVGGSRFRRYHGKHSFDNFSHEKVVVARSFFIDVWFRYPPWDDKKGSRVPNIQTSVYVIITDLSIPLEISLWYVD